MTSITALKTRADQLIRNARETRQPVFITQNGRVTAVLQDIESFDRREHTLLMLKLVLQGDAAYRRGEVLTDEEAGRHFRAKLGALRAGG